MGVGVVVIVTDLLFVTAWFYLSGTGPPGYSQKKGR